MSMLIKAFARKLFGVKYEYLKRWIPVCLVVFWGLYTADFSIEIAPGVFFFMTGAFSAGVMGQALLSKDHAGYMQNLFMLPFERKALIFAYAGTLGVYTLVTKTAILFLGVLAVTDYSWIQIMFAFLCAVNGVLLPAAFLSVKKYWLVSCLWLGIVLAGSLFLWDRWYIWPLLFSSVSFAVFLLARADAYSFYILEREKQRSVNSRSYGLVWRYFWRYLFARKNYLVNTGILWCVAWILPFFFKNMEEPMGISIGFGVLSLNTPLCILLSSDPALEQAVRFLPGQKKGFCIPYCLFLFLWNTVANGIFLLSVWMQMGDMDEKMLAAGIFFALQSAIFSVLLEWFYPIRGWKIESDLWHHPRKYIVPAVMLLLGGLVGMVPGILAGLFAGLTAEGAVLLYQCWKNP